MVLRAFLEHLQQLKVTPFGMNFLIQQLALLNKKEMLHFFKDGIMYNWTPITEFVGIMNQTLAVV